MTVVVDRDSNRAQPLLHMNTYGTLTYKVPEEEKEAPLEQAQNPERGYKSAYVEMLAALQLNSKFRKTPAKS